MRDELPVTLLNTARASATAVDEPSLGSKDVSRFPRTELSIVIPAFNEEKTLPKTLPAVVEAASAHGACEVIVVDDGSNDDTLRVAGEILAAYSRSELVWHPQNRGKGAAVKSGVSRARGRKIIFVDADLAPEFSTGLKRALAELEEAELAIASRAVPGAEVVGAKSRRILGLGFRVLRKMVVGLEVADTQCGLKAFRASAAKVLFHSLTSAGFVFDVELLLAARWLGLKVAEFPLRWVAVEPSGVRPLRDGISMAAGLLRLRFWPHTAPPVPSVEFASEGLDSGARARIAAILRHGDLVVEREGRISILLFCAPLEAARSVASRVSSLLGSRSPAVSLLPGDTALRLARAAFHFDQDGESLFFA